MEARYRGRSRYYPGKISRVNRDGNVVVARGTMNAPPLILVPHGVDLLKG